MPVTGSPGRSAAGGEPATAGGLTSRAGHGSGSHAGRHKRAGGTPGRPRPRVYLHIGEPKTGTTFLQDVLWANRSALASQGIVLPGFNRRDHSRASRDLRERWRAASDPADPWAGEWEVLAGEALRAPHAAIISDEVLAVCTPAQADRAVRSLSGADLHVVLTVRDLAGLLPAEWQETVKCRGTLGWEPWLREVVEVAPAADRRSRSLFWNMHDTLANLTMWSRHLPPDRVHVVVTPRQNSGRELWDRFASVLEIDPDAVDAGQARTNASLGYAETEYLRGINERLPADMPEWFYTRTIKQILAHGVLRTGAGPRGPALPPELAGWVAEQAGSVRAGLRESGAHIVGDLGDLQPAGPAGQPGPVPAQAGQPDQLLDMAAASAVALAEALYRQLRPEPARREPAGGPRQALSRLEWTLLHGRGVEWVLRRASHVGVVRRLRVAIWCALLHPARAVPSQPRRLAGEHGASETTAMPTPFRR